MMIMIALVTVRFLKCILIGLIMQPLLFTIYELLTEPKEFLNKYFDK